MPKRQVPVRPSLAQLESEAQELFESSMASGRSPAPANLLEARDLLAKEYGVSTWSRLALACDLIDAMWTGAVERVRELINKHPELLRENARASECCNWGRPLSYAANVGDNTIVQMLFDMGADDLDFAFDRASLRGKISTARFLHSLGARPGPDAVMGPCEALSAAGLALQLEVGAVLRGRGDPLAPIAMVLETYSRNPEGKHGCLELLAEQGVALPDTPVFAIHRGRPDLLQLHVARDPGVLNRNYTHEEIYPLTLGCHADKNLALHGTPIDGGTLLHLCVDYDELELARWLLDHGANPNTPATVDANGFGGHTALFGCVVSQPYRCGRSSLPMARLLLERGARPHHRATLRKALRFVDDESLHEYHDVTPSAFGRKFHDQDWVDREVLGLLERPE